MAEIQGYCMKCKTYGPIKNGEKIAMANGRGWLDFVPKLDAGKISRIIA